MEKNINHHHHQQQQQNGVGGGVLNNGGRDELLRTSAHPTDTRSAALATTSSDFVLQWGNRKRLRCMKAQARDRAAVDRLVVRSDLNGSKGKDSTAYLNLRRRPAAPYHRILRSSEGLLPMKGGHSRRLRGLSSPDRGRGVPDRRGNRTAHHNTTTTTAAAIPNHHHHHNNHHHHSIVNINTTSSIANHHQDSNGGVVVGSMSPAVQDSKKGGGEGSSSGGSDARPSVWPPKFVIALTNKEKEEDFFIFKGSKLPQRPKKRAKLVQRTLNLVSPGAWLCDLTLDRYEVREKKTSKKRPRGLKAMGNMESDSE